MKFTICGLAFPTITIIVNFMAISSMPLSKLDVEFAPLLPKNQTPISTTTSGMTSQTTTFTPEQDKDSRLTLSSDPTHDANANTHVKSSINLPIKIESSTLFSAILPHPNSVESKKEQLLDSVEVEDIRQDALGVAATKSPSSSQTSMTASTAELINSNESPKNSNVVEETDPSTNNPILSNQPNSQSNISPTILTGMLIKIPPPIAPEIITHRPNYHRLPGFFGESESSPYNFGEPLSILDEYHRHHFYTI
jgi:hypothetical protein